MTWNEIYHHNLEQVLAAPNSVLYANSFIIEDPYDHRVANPRSCNYEYTENFFNWILSGSKDISTMHNLPTGPGNRAKEFEIDFEGRCTAYGPRILDQLPGVVDMLLNYPSTRRACIMILDAEDQDVALALHKGETKCEYPCNMGMTFWIDEGELHMHTTMRSNNYTSTVCIDVFICCNLLIKVASMVGRSVGKYYHHAVNAHILPRDRSRAIEIMHEHHEKNVGES